MKNNKKYLLTEIALVLFHIFISLIIFLIPLCVNEMMNGRIIFTTEVIFFIIALMFAEIILQLVYTVMEQHLMKNCKISMSKEIYHKIFSMKYSSLIRYGTTYLVERADSAVLTFSNLSIRSVPVLISEMIIIVLILGYALSINVVMFLLMAFILVLNVAGFYFLNKSLLKKTAEMQRIIPKERKDIYQVAGQIDFIKQNDDNNRLDGILEDHLKKIEIYTMKVNTFAGGMSGLINFFNMFAQNIILIFLFYLFLQGRTELNGIFTVSILLSYFLPAIMSIVSVNLDLREIKASRDFMKLLEENQESSGDIVIDKIDEVRIDMEKLLTADGAVLAKEIHLKARKGDVVGIVGESGCGKTTLMKSVLKFWEQNQGVYINDIPLERLDNVAYRNRISFYSQNVPIITGALYDSLNFGRPDIGQGAYEELAFLSKFKKDGSIAGTEILENGNNLSGGDKQRIALARLYTEDVDVLVLDEPTSSLDEKTEEQILGMALRQKEKIIFLITHRKENLKYCNKIYQFADKGVQEMSIYAGGQ